MKKYLKRAAGIALSAALCFSVAACGGNTDQSEISEQRKVYNAYVAYAQMLGEDILSYEEWLESIRGKDGQDGKDGIDGLTPHIGENGNWWLGDTDTGIKAEGKDGKDGKDGVDGQDGKDGENGQDLTAQEVTLTFDVNGGNLLEEETITLSKGDSIDLPAPTRKGHKFLGWFYGTGVNAGQVTDVTPISRDMTVVARWELDPDWTPDEMPTKFVSPIENGKILTKHRDIITNIIGNVTRHPGIDIEAQVGDTVRCMAAGVVEAIYEGEEEGNRITINHGNGLKSIYRFIDLSDLEVGDTVSKGEVIGTVSDRSNYGTVDDHRIGIHLHFEVMLEEKSVDPLDFIPYEEVPAEDEDTNEYVSPIENGNIAVTHGQTIPVYQNSIIGWRYITHKGVDFEAQVGDAVRCMADGVVEEVSDSAETGNTVIINHGNGLKSIYRYIDFADLEVGDTVSKGEVIGTVSAIPEGGYMAGEDDGIHLHFEVWLEEESVDPMDYIPFKEQED